MTPEKHASKYKEWADLYNWDTCQTGRERYGKFLISILTSETDGQVINLNGAWGTGKTEFLKRLYVSLAEQGHPVIYIDAWESDFIKDPLTVICAEFLNQLGFTFANNNQDKFEEIKDTLNELMGRIASISKILAPVNAGYKAFSNDPTLVEEIEFAETLLKISRIDFKSKGGVVNNNSSLMEQMLGSQMELVEGMKCIRKQITAISEILTEVYDLNSPIVVLIDELDRCRPDYAIKILEVVKHFFDVKGCNFLIATDTNSLQQSIKAVYGNGFNSENYLRRFFNQKITLQRPSIEDYIKNKNIDFINMCPNVKLAPFNGDNERIIHYLSTLLSTGIFQLRDIERFIQKLVGSLTFIDKNKIKKENAINLAVLAYAIYEHEISPSNFFARKNNVFKDPVSQSGSFINSVHMTEFLSIQIKSVIISNSNRQYNLKGGGSTTFAESKTMLKIQAEELHLSSKNGWGNTFLLTECCMLVDEYRTNPKSYWLWEDYQKMAGLTDAIE